MVNVPTTTIGVLELLKQSDVKPGHLAADLGSPRLTKEEEGALLAKQRGEAHRGDAAAETLQHRKAAKKALKEAQRQTK